MLKNIIFYNEAINGTDFKTGAGGNYLHGNVGDRVKVVAEFDALLQSISDSTTPYIYEALTTTTGQVTRDTGSFLEDGFFPGQQIELTDGTQRIVLKLTFVDELYFTFNILFGTWTAGTYPDGVSNPEMTVTCVQDLSGFVYRWNAIENGEAANYTSKYNERTNELKGAITRSGITTLTANQGCHVDGSVQVNYVGNASGTHTIRVTHIFKIPPMYLDEFSQNLEAGTVPTLLITQNSLKYIFRAEMRFDQNNPNSVLVEEFDKYKGSVGWYDEELDSLAPEFAVTDITYQNAANGESLDGIKPDINTLILATITGNFDTNTAFVAKVLTAMGAEIYQDTNDDFDTTFNFGSLYLKGENVVAGSGAIVQLRTIYASPTECQVRINVDYSTNQQARIDGQKFILALGLSDQSKALNVQNKCTLLLAYEDYVAASDVPGLLEFTEAEVWGHADNVATTGKTSYRGWPEDGLLLRFKAEIEDGCLLTGLRYGVMARNLGDGRQFMVNEFQCPLGNPPVALSGAQKFNVDTTRGFLLNATDPFNQVVLETTAESPFTIQGYCGIKIGWQDWIANPDVVADFIDTTKPNNNLNRLASNYETPEGFSLFAVAICEIQDTNGNRTEYAKLVEMDAYPFGEDGETPPAWACVPKICDTSFNETAVYDTTGYNNIRIIFTPASGATADYANFKGVIRLQKVGQGGESIHELSSFRATYLGNLLEPLVGETFAKVTVNAGTVYLDCRVDGRLLENGGSGYRLSGRLWTTYAGVGTPVFQFSAETYISAGDYTIPVVATDSLAAALPAGRLVTIKVKSGSTLLETLTGKIGDDIATFVTDNPIPTNSFVVFASGTVTNGGTVAFNKYDWAVANTKTNAFADTLSLLSTVVDRGQASVENTQVLPVRTIPGKGFPKDIAYLSATKMVFVDHITGIRTLTNDLYTELLGSINGATSVDVDQFVPANPLIYTVDSLGAIKYWDNSNRKDLGKSGVGSTAFVEGTFTPTSIFVNNARQNSSKSDLWLPGDRKLILRWRNGLTWSRADFSSKITAISATAVVQSVCMDANGVLWCLCNVPGSGSLIISMAKTGGGLYHLPSQWTATLRISDAGIGQANGISGAAQFSGDCRKIIIIGYDGSIGATAGTNPMLFISDYGNNFYRVLQSVVGVWTVSAPVLYCGAPGSTIYSFGAAGSPIEVGSVSGMCYVDGVGSPGKLYGTGEGTPNRILFSVADFSNAVSQLASSLFEGTTGYLEQTAF